MDSKKIGLTPEKFAREVYAKKAGSFIEPPLFWWDYWKDQIIKFSEHIKGEHVLSLGCGTAYDAEFFERLGYSFTGIDITPEMLEMAKLRRNSAKLSVMNMYELGFKPNSFDAVWSFDSSADIPKDKMPTLLSHIHRVLKPKGVMYIALATDGHFEKWDEEEGLISSWDPDIFKQELVNNGFRIIDQITELDKITAFIASPNSNQSNLTKEN